ncbi:hypothetical protein AB0K34_14165 [Actinomadura sp. NPDC049382]|uniref:hypothetical protein n=1 Tax=Actinomadura sp. NPDC049382 TaxID=3158220 RepID=UPI00342E1FF8
MTARRRTVGLALAVLAAAGTAACDSDQTPTASPSASTSATAAPSPSASAPSPRSTSSAGALAGIPPKPSPQNRAAFLAALNRIDPDIIGDKDPDLIVDRGRNQCSSVKNRPDDQAYLIRTTNIRFTAPGHPGGFGEAKAARILKAVRKYLCPTW